MVLCIYTYIYIYINNVIRPHQFDKLVVGCARFPYFQNFFYFFIFIFLNIYLFLKIFKDDHRKILFRAKYINSRSLNKGSMPVYVFKCPNKEYTPEVLYETNKINTFQIARLNNNNVKDKTPESFNTQTGHYTFKRANLLHKISTPGIR